MDLQPWLIELEEQAEKENVDLPYVDAELIDFWEIGFTPEEVIRHFELTADC